MPDPYRSKAGSETRHEGEWSDRTAGGSTNNPQMHDLNPKWAIKLGTGTEPPGTRHRLRIQLFGSREKAVGIALRAAGHESHHTEVILTSVPLFTGFTGFTTVAPCSPLPPTFPRAPSHTMRHARVGAPHACRMLIGRLQSDSMLWSTHVARHIGLGSCCCRPTRLSPASATP